MADLDLSGSVALPNGAEGLGASDEGNERSLASCNTMELLRTPSPYAVCSVHNRYYHFLIKKPHTK